MVYTEEVCSLTQGWTTSGHEHETENETNILKIDCKQYLIVQLQRKNMQRQYSYFVQQWLQFDPIYGNRAHLIVLSII